MNTETEKTAKTGSVKTPERSSSGKSGSEHRIVEQPGFVLHSYVYKESSLVVDVFTRDYGRVALVAKGAKRPTSRLRGVLQTFQPLSIGWTGKSELRTLTTAEWIGGMIPLENSALLYGFYLNELLLKLTAREDPHHLLFDHYVKALNRLATSESAQTVLRIFELALLKETGVAADLSIDTTTRQKVGRALLRKARKTFHDVFLVMKNPLISILYRKRFSVILRYRLYDRYLFYLFTAPGVNSPYVAC